MAKNKVQKLIIDDNTIFKRNEEDFLITEVDGESVMMNTIEGSYWGLNETTTHIWTFLETSSSFRQVLDNILNTYDVDEETCRKDTLLVIVRLLKLQILSIENPVEKTT